MNVKQEDPPSVKEEDPSPVKQEPTHQLTKSRYTTPEKNSPSRNESRKCKSMSLSPKKERMD